MGGRSLSATAKALMAFHEKHVGAAAGGAVWVPEEVYEKLIELARREAKPGSGCRAHGVTDCLVCKYAAAGRGGSQ